MTDQENTENLDRGDLLDAGIADLDPDKVDLNKVDPDKLDKTAKPESENDDEDDEGEDEDEAAKIEAQVKADAKKKDSRIPLSRHKDILAKAHAERDRLEAELAKAVGAKNVEDSTARQNEAEKQISVLEKEYGKLLADGDVEKATAKMGEIRRMERAVIEEKAAFQAEVAQAQAVETVRYEATADRLIAAYPQLDADHEDFDADTLKEVMRLQRAFRADGESPSRALQDAVKYVLKPETRKQESATEVNVRVDPNEVAKARKEAAVKRNVDAANKTPSNLGKVGKDTNAAGGGIDINSVMKMSQDDFAKLDEAQLSKMRGDSL